MAAIPKELIESELFGHEKGAFTGAVARKAGKLKRLMEELSSWMRSRSLTLACKVKILRVLQEREITRVGGSEKVKLEVRLIVATHKSLSEEVNKGNFREDLYYRIIGLPIELPPLRERGNDILVLARHFADEFSKENKLGNISIAGNAKEKTDALLLPGQRKGAESDDGTCGSYEQWP
jgi:transcriptional regulator with GAF, ATPase, and Fis domain